MSDLTLTCRICGSVYDLPAGENHRPCPACGTENCRPQMEADVGDTLRRATSQRLRCDFKHAEDSYQYVLKTSPDEHEALWGLVQCRYAVEYVKDPRTGKLMPIVHAVQKRPMLTDPDFREACDLAPEAIRAQYRQEAEYIDGAMARIRELAAKGDAYDVFLCHKTTRTDGEEGYTEDFKRATQLYMKLEKTGYRVFFAPFAGLTAGDNYEAGIYHAIATAKVMLVVCSNQDYINSPWVRTEWQRFLEMSYEPGADKHLIPLLYEGFSPRRLPDDFRQLQAIAMGELDATETLMATVAKHVGKATAVGTVPAPVPEPKPVSPEPVPKTAQPTPKPSKSTSIPMHPTQMPLQPKTTLAPTQPDPIPLQQSDANPIPTYALESYFTCYNVAGGVSITGYKGPAGEVRIPPMIGDKCVRAIGGSAFAKQRYLTRVIIPEGVTNIGDGVFSGCSNLIDVSFPTHILHMGHSVLSGCSRITNVSLPEGLTGIGNHTFYGCTNLVNVNIPDSVTNIGAWAFCGCSSLADVSIPKGTMCICESAFEGCSGLAKVSIPASVTSIGHRAFRGCNSLVNVLIPERTAYIGDEVFSCCTSLQHIAVAPGNPTYYVENGALLSRKQRLICYAAGLPARHYAIPEGVKTIGSGAFRDLWKLVSVRIPESVVCIEALAFSGCSCLYDLILPEIMPKIGYGAFDGCRSLPPDIRQMLKHAPKCK